MNPVSMKNTSVCLLLITIFLGLLRCTLSNPYGFLNINCGEIGNQTDKNGLDWIADSYFIKSRNTSTLRSLDSLYLQYRSLAYFPNLAAKKYCYLLPVKPGLNYFVRASFSLDESDDAPPLARFFDLVIEGIKWTNVNLSDLDSEHVRYQEIIMAAKSEGLSLCLARNSQTEENSFVFISSIELRQLNSSMYNSTDFQKQALYLVNRINFGASAGYFSRSDSYLQYPDDPFDRSWEPYNSSLMTGYGTEDVAAEDYRTEALGRELFNKPPVNVLSTAIATIEEVMTITGAFSYFSDPDFYSFELYFCNINETMFTQSLIFYINGYQVGDYLQIEYLQCRQVHTILELKSPDPISITLNSSYGYGPFINAAEMYKILNLQKTTHFGDVLAIRKIAEAINVPDDWAGGDPCLPADYSSTGITCSQDDPPRVIIINLTNMNLKGDIPSNIADLTALTDLLLGNNELTGHIPDLSLLKNLKTLQLQNNQLTGKIPRSLEKLQKLKHLYLQNNKLEGTVSKGLVRPSLDLRVDPENHIPASNPKIRSWIIGLVIGCSVVLVLVLVYVIFLWRLKHPSRPRPTTDGSISSEQRPSAEENNQKDHHRLPMEYTEKDIKIATNNYSTLIGKGGFGSVFYGRLSGYEVAVKILLTDSNQGQQEFQNEITLLSRIYHKNLVSLIGYCRQPIIALVYEYMHQGTLTDHLYGVAKLEAPLDWYTRLNIAVQAAEGLLYLHQGCRPPIIHRDIKCSNILLDNRMFAKLADFGVSKLVESSKGFTSTQVKGTMGYLDPEYFGTSSLNEKSDVYSFGVVLLEIISGVSPKQGIVETMRKLLSCGKIVELMDSSLGGRYDLESAWKVAEIAYTCVEKESKNRPKMNRVLKELQEAVALAYDDKNHSAQGTMASFNIDDMPNTR